MEGYFHSHTRSHSRGPTTLSGNKNKKPPPFPTNDRGGGGFSATSYDDVFGGAPKYAALAPRAEDYSEIFGAFRSSSSRASSIPVLDLPAAADMDSGASVFDYTEVFGGFHAVDFAVTFDELFQPFDVGDGCSSDEAWTPVGTESLSDDSDLFASSEKSQCFSNENSLQPLDSKQFTVSYHRVNIGTNTCPPNMIHVAQLNAVPGYTCVVDETTSSQEMGTETLCSVMGDDNVFSVDSSSTMRQKHKRKTMSKMSLNDVGTEPFDGDCTSGRARAASMSHVNSTCASVSDINLIMETSHLPPPRPFPVEAERKVDISILNSGLKASKNCALESTVDSGLPPCFDMEVDSSSSAAASAAAVRDVMEKAQAKLKAAKVLMDRKRDDLQDTAKLNLKTDVHAGDEGPAKMKNSVKVRCPTTTSQILPDSLAVEQPVVIRKPAEKKHGKKCSLSMDTVFNEGTGAWKEATEFYEFVTDNPKLAPEPPSKSERKTVAFKKQGNDDDSDSTGEACVPEGNRRRLKPTKAVSRQEYYDKMVKVAQEVHDRVLGGHAEADQTLTGMPQGNHREQKAKFGYEPEINASKIGQGKPVEEEKPGETAWKEEAKKGSTTAFEKEEIKKNETKKKGTEACQREQDVGKTYGPHQSQSSDKEFPRRKEEERRKTESYDRVASERRVQVVVNEENEKRAKEAYESQRKENKLADAVKQKKDKLRKEVKDKRAKEPFKDGFDGERMHTACESQVNGKTEDLKRKVEDKRLKETLVDVFGGETLQITCEIQEKEQRKNLVQRDEELNYAEVAVDGRGSERILEESFPGQVVRKRQDECHKLAAGDQISEECLKRDDNKEELEKITEQETDENKPMQAAEMDEGVKIPEKTDVEDQNGVSKNRLNIELEDEDAGSYGSPEIDLSIENELLNSSDGANAHEKNVEEELDILTAKLNKPPTEADVFQDVSPRISSKASDESKLKEVETTYVFDTEKPTESIAAQRGADDIEHERTVHASDSLDRNDSNGKSGQVCITTGQELKDDNKKIARSVSDHELVKDSNLVKSTPAEGINGWNEHARKKEVADTVMQERKESIQKNSQLPNISQSAERKGKINNQNRYSEEKTKEKERDPEKEEQFRKLEEEREREREREKDRMAVEITIHEARERAYADVRERATDEARQRAMSEARERLGKACSEARGRSLADKASDARLRAERAAVERATTEARQRAFEKAMAERVTFEARERMQRSVSEKYTSERDVVMRQSSIPSTHSEKFEAADGEPAQRCKARLERHRRTVERVAKALAEKNMRDLIAQREGAERTRLAENLDADIKRWSSGKEGNLRALLSTLQYILGPDCGWQPIPLSEVITAAAVKKAYRKATLCVHPDKLQQRGASIQEKYVCEKVFDLLKEAWNRFNSEEK